ncbi:hypothetical protein [Dactylosporangium sp. CA-233914]
MRPLQGIGEQMVTAVMGWWYRRMIQHSSTRGSATYRMPKTM